MFGGTIDTQFCDGQGNCQGVVPGTRRVHQYLHDRIGWYRYWHHSPIRIPAHLLVAGLTLLFAGAVLLAPKTTQNPQAAVGILAQFPFQGRLTNTDGTVVADSTYDAIFQLYTVDTGGVAVWTENHTGVDQITTTDGIFNTLLGSITTLAGIDFNQDEYWLGITVGADAEMTPRVRLGAAPYAFNTDALDGISGEDFLQLNGQAGGQTVYGGTAASENLVLNSTSHATKGDVIVNDDFVPSTDDAYDLGSSSKRFRDLYLGPTTLHVTTTVAETATARDWKLNVDETNGATDGDLRIQEGANSYFSITTAGNVVLGSAALATSATNGFLYTPSVPGTPTGVPTTYTGRVPLVYNTAANTLYFYNAGWQPVSGGGGITGSGAAGRVTVWSGASAVTSDAEYLYDSTQNRLSIGTTPSTDTAAVLSIPNDKFISARNAANSANIEVIGLNSLNFIELGQTSSQVTTLDMPTVNTSTFRFQNSNAGAGALSLMQIEGALEVFNTDAYGSNPADTGAIRLANEGFITGHNAANSADVTLIGISSNNYIRMGTTTAGVTDIDIASANAAFRFRDSAGGTANMQIEGALSVYNSNEFASTVATAGHIRLPNSATVTADAVGSGGTGGGNTNLVQLTSDDFIQFGPTSSGIIDIEAGVSNGQFRFRNGAGATGGNASVSIEGHLEVHSTNGFGTVASAGHIRVPNNAPLTARNSGNSANIDLIKLNTSNYIQLGQTAASTVDIDIAAANGVFNFRDSAGGNANVNIEGYLGIYNSNEFASTNASQGNIRLPNLATMYGRNQANSGDILMMRVNSSNQFETGVDIAVGGDFYDTTIPASVSATTLCIAGLGQIGTCTSDARLKENINDISSGLDIIEQLSPKTYDFISGQTNQSGFLAQDIQPILPGLVTKNTGDDYLSLNYDGILAYAVKAIQELNQELDVIDAKDSGKADTLSLATMTTGSLTVHDNAVLNGKLFVDGGVELASTLLVKEVATFEKDVAIGGNLTVTGSILGSSQTRGINVPVEVNSTFLDVKDLELPEDSTYAVSVTPSWRTGFWVTDKTAEDFTIHFDVPAPLDATTDYLIQR